MKKLFGLILAIAFTQNLWAQNEDLGDGLFYCHSCNAKGNGYQFAKQMNIPNPHQYIVDTTPVNLPVKTGNTNDQKINLDSLLKRYIEKIAVCQN